VRRTLQISEWSTTSTIVCSCFSSQNEEIYFPFFPPYFRWKTCFLLLVVPSSPLFSFSSFAFAFTGDFNGVTRERCTCRTAALTTSCLWPFRRL
jgi:hypothetical protein